MIILDHLHILNQLSKAKARKYAIQLYNENAMFKAYVDLAYSMKSIYNSSRKKIPVVFIADNVPDGYHYSQLERQYKPIHKLYSTTDDKMFLNRLAIIMEGISPVEQDFVQQILKGRLKCLTQEEYRGFKDYGQTTRTSETSTV